VSQWVVDLSGYIGLSPVFGGINSHSLQRAGDSSSSRSFMKDASSYLSITSQPSIYSRILSFHNNQSQSVLTHPGRVAEEDVAVVCNGRGFDVLVETLGGKVKVCGSVHPGGNMLAEGIQCARIKILELLRLVAGMIILELYDLLQVHTSP